MRLPLRLVATISVSVVCAVGMVWLAFWDNRYLDDPTKTSKEEHTAEFKQSKSQKFAHDIVGPGKQCILIYFFLVYIEQTGQLV